MFEAAIGFLGAYLARKAGGLLGRAAGDADAAFDTKLGHLYDWVKGKVTGRTTAERSLRLLEKHPDDADVQDSAIEELGTTIASNPEHEAELAAMVSELERLRPPTLRIRGVASSYIVAPGATQTGAVAEGDLPAGTEISGEAVTGNLYGTQTGAVYRSGTKPPAQ